MNPNHYPMPFRRLLFLLTTLVTWSAVVGQDLPVGLPLIDDLQRNAQINGTYAATASYCIRPLAKGGDSVSGWSTFSLLPDSARWSQRLRCVLLPPSTIVQYNHHHPYGWSNGPMIPNVGAQFFATAGLYVKVGFLEAQYQPEWVYAQNKAFMNPPARAVSIDMPDRFGTEAYRYSGAGQSFVRATAGPVRVGLSTENIWWGPGHFNSILMSNNAPGFIHGAVETSKPLQTKVGIFEAQMIGARMRYSGYQYARDVDGSWPPSLPDVYRDTTVDPLRKNFNGLVVAYQPVWLPGLSVGGARSVFFETDSVASFYDYLQVFLPVLKVISGEDGGARNQLVSLFMRYKLPESKAEFYFEYAREDAAWDFEDLITEPEHTRAYLVGGRKLQPLLKKNAYLEIVGEITQLQQGFSLISRARNYSFYTHGASTNYTHRGQVLGAGMGPGSNMQTMSIIRREGVKALGVVLERVIYNNDMFYTRLPYLWLGGSNPFFVDASKHYTDLSGTVVYSTPYKQWLLTARLQGLKTYNFNWIYDPEGVPNDFRFPGISAFTINATVSALYRF